MRLAIVTILTVNAFCSQLSWAEPELEPSALEQANLDRQLDDDYITQLQALYSSVPLAPVGQMTPQSLAADADLAIHGKVISVSYSHEGPFNQPYFTTEIEILQILKGQSLEKKISIKQPGGPSKEGDLINIVSHTEFFAATQQEILFLTRKEKDFVIERRFKVYKGELYSPDGLPLLMLPSKALILGSQRVSEPIFNVIEIGAEQLTKVFSDLEHSSAFKTDEETVSKTQNSVERTAVSLVQFTLAMDSETDG